MIANLPAQATILPLQQPPSQTLLKPPRERVMLGYRLQEVASYTITARVLRARVYRTGKLADLIPFDLALGWGPMADMDVLSHIRIWQTKRFYHWYAAHYPIPRDQIVSNSANTHIIPANDRVEKIIGGLRLNQIITLHGELVNIIGPGGRHWQTSLTRQDTGKGACEIMLVEDVTID